MESMKTGDVLKFSYVLITDGDGTDIAEWVEGPTVNGDGINATIRWDAEKSRLIIDFPVVKP